MSWSTLLTPSKEAWHLAEIYLHAWDAELGNVNLFVYVDGALLYEVRDEYAGVRLDNFYVGLGGIDADDAGTIYFDDIVVDTMKWVWDHTDGGDYSRPNDGLIPPVRSTFGLMSGGLD